MSLSATSSKQKFWERNKKVANRVIRGQLARNKRNIVHGTRATNAQLPRRLNVKTTDWDVKNPNPLLAALKMERKLDKKFRGNFFKVEEGATKELSVHKVKSTVDGKTYVDFSIRKEPMPSVAKRGVRLATLKNQVEKAKETLKDPSKEFRRAKDLDLIRRVSIFEKKSRRKI